MELFLASKGAFTWLRSRVTVTGERGATAVEYGIIACFICAVVVIAVFFLGQSTNHNLDCSGQTIAAQSAPVC
ncbi:MAG TPA: Flp family type IVb pilin [Actinomycetota bacterium]|nr:Flp family type IVb pilin [Actinomycetota bacterium]